MILFSAAATIGGCLARPACLWQILDSQPQPQAWNTIFGAHGERGEYMDGYSETAMVQRCQEDYRWTKTNLKDTTECLLSERAKMMSHLYDNDDLWDYTSMVAFADHYVLDPPSEMQGDTVAITTKPFETFQRHKKSRPEDRPIFGGVVLSDWERQEQPEGHGIEQKLGAFRQKGIDYVRLECNLGSDDDIGGPEAVATNTRIRNRLKTLAGVARACQTQELVPLVLLQFPWRDPGVSLAYFEQAVKAFCEALHSQGVEPQKVLFETRPPIGMSAQQERGLSGPEKVSLGLRIGKAMFDVMEEAFGDHPIAGFCVAGGSTKGAMPTAMEDDTQNAVRQGIRMKARQTWGYELCFWEMGAKLMLQPKVGRLWNHNQGGASSSGRDASRELFCVNAQDLADEIKTELVL